MFTTDTWLKIICSVMTNAVVFGTGAILVLSIPALSTHAPYLIPAVIMLSFIAAPFLAIPVARRMRIQNWGKTRWTEGDAVSG